MARGLVVVCELLVVDNGMSEDSEGPAMNNDEFQLKVGGYTFDCYYQQGFLGNRWKETADGDTWVAVCKCGRGVFGSSQTDAVEKLRNSYSILRPTEHFHWEGTVNFNVILGFDESWIMGTIRAPELLAELDEEKP